MFFDAKIKEESNSVRSLIYTLATDFFHSSSFYASSKDNNEYATIESLNMLAAVKVLGNNFVISPQIISKIVNLKKDRVMSYFEIITLLYYIGDTKESVYVRIKDDVVKHAKKILNTLDDLKENSEKCHLLLDILACPFVDKSIRNGLAKDLWKNLFHKIPSDAEADKLQNDLAKYPWFASWDSAEILNSLEKKALLRSY